MNFYLTPALPALAICAGFAFAGREIAVVYALFLLFLAAAKNFVPVALPAAGYLGVALAIVGAIAHRQRSGQMLLILSLFVVALPRSLEFCPFATPDAEIRTAIASCLEDSLSIGTWEDPRTDWFDRRGSVQAKWDDAWSKPDVYFMSGERNTTADREYPERWCKFLTFLKRHYVVSRNSNALTVYMRDRSIMPNAR